MLELILFGGAVLRDRLLALVKDVWNEGRVFDAWRDALIVPVPKKDNHRNSCKYYLIKNSQAVKKGAAPKKAMVKKDVKSKVAAKKWL